eukprot:XP_008660995.1 uncharacterized protein LOC103640128 [Zea mays]
MAVRQTGGWDPHCGIWISDAPAGGPQPAGVAPSAPAVAPSPLDKGKGATSSASVPGGSGGSEEESYSRVRENTLHAPGAREPRQGTRARGPPGQGCRGAGAAGARGRGGRGVGRMAAGDARALGFLSLGSQGHTSSAGYQAH